ncbi:MULTISPECIES: hypothetical protein [Bacillus]|uniref:Uncharacterized protein n=1 Tax=Bacillus mycoides TaxID=1405 RepID=A0A3D9UWS8_BACMY|nr:MULTISPECIES: hypothetical protein [Bacillus]RBP20663.1 hypothetical protein DET63_11666 [Bacillus sp. DB-2]REF33938.1 hypothetical protein DET55_111102 [Bacillus mycoides]
MSKAVIKKGYWDHFVMFEAFKHNDSKKALCKYEKIIDKLIQSELIISAETQDKKVSFNKKFEDELANRRKAYLQAIQNNKIVPAHIRGDVKKVAETSKVFIQSDDKSITVDVEENIEDELRISQSNALQQLISLYNLEQKHTGFFHTSFKNRFLIMPVKVEISEATFYINVIVTIFKHGYCMIHFSINVANIDINILNLSIWNMHFDKVMFPERMINDCTSMEYKKKARCNTLFDITSVYLEYLSKYLGIEEQINTTRYNHLNLIDYTYRPKNFEDKDISNPLKANIFELLFAPVSEFTMNSDKNIDTLLNQKKYELNMYFRSYANHNRLINIYGSRIDQAFKSMDENPFSEMTLYNTAIGGSINSIELLMQKKLQNDKITFVNLNSAMTLNDLIKIKTQSNLEYFHEFSQYYYSYASVNTFTNFLNNACDDYLKSEMVIERNKRMEELITLRKEKYVSKFTALSPILTITITLLFSLPTLKQLLELLKLEEYLLPIYTISNFIFIIFICILYRELIKEKSINLFNYFVRNVFLIYKYSKSEFLEVEKYIITRSKTLNKLLKFKILKLQKKVSGIFDYFKRRKK